MAKTSAFMGLESWQHHLHIGLGTTALQPVSLSGFGPCPLRPFVCIIDRSIIVRIDVKVHMNSVITLRDLSLDFVSGRFSILRMLCV